MPKTQNTILSFFTKTNINNSNTANEISTEPDNVSVVCLSSSSIITSTGVDIQNGAITQPTQNKIQSSLHSGNASLPDLTYPYDISKEPDSQPSQPRLNSFPKTKINDRFRSFSNNWYEKHPFLEYSKDTDMIYCFVCRHFAVGRRISLTTGCNDWKNLGQKCREHFGSEIHQNSEERYFSYKQSKTTGSVTTQLNSQHKFNVMGNREVLSAIIEVIILCAQQDIALRGHRENDDEQNCGNFIAILKLLESKCPSLQSSMSRMPKNAKYHSPKIQNEIINICGTMTQEMIVEEIKEDRECYSVIGDESKDNSGTEQLSVCVRYVHNCVIKERFLGFVDLHEFDADAISLAIIKLLKDAGLCIKCCVSQSYDGASVMSGDLSGVHIRIEQEVGVKCPYVHCYALRLNLALVSSCEVIVEVRDTLGLLQAIYNFQSNSVKRSEQFQTTQISLGYTPVLKLPKTTDLRWSTKKKSFHYFKSRYDSVLVALDSIIKNRKGEEVAEATGYKLQLCDFKHILIVFIMNEILAITNALSEYLQCPELLYSRALYLCSSSVKSLREFRTDLKFDEIWSQASEMARKVKVDVPNGNDEHNSKNKRKLTTSKKLASYVVLSSTGARERTYTKQSLKLIYYEIIDTFISEMNAKLTTNEDIGPGVTAADPRSDNFLNCDDVIQFCKYFPRFSFDFDSLKAQIPVARNLLIAEKMNRVLDCYNYLCTIRSGFTDLILFYRLVLTIPVSSVTAERSFSSLNRVKTYLRSTMGEERVSNLCLLSMERDLSDSLKHDVSSVVDRFASITKRNVEFNL